MDKITVKQVLKISKEVCVLRDYTESETVEYMVVNVCDIEGVVDPLDIVKHYLETGEVL